MEQTPVASPATAALQFCCNGCGAKLTYQPGTTSLACQYCGSVNDITLERREVEELDFLASVGKTQAADATDEVLTVKCASCAAEVRLGANQTADRCAFCGSPIVAGQSSRKLIKPQCLLPFSVGEQDARKLFRAWIAELWFAPNALTREAGGVQLRGIYIPAWTYDSRTRTDYTGQRGDDYWETESYWDTETYTTMEGGRSVTRTRQVHKTRQVRKTRWSSVSGRVHNDFDDVLVLASSSLPADLAQKLEPWDLKSLISYQDEFISGFVCETYSVDLEQGFATARQIMSPAINATICSDIGGDHQRISSSDTKYFNTTYKHILLPVWLCAYRYHDGLYRFLVNARTGEIQGERPYSAAKIALLVGVILLVVTAIALIVAQSQ